MDTNTRNQKEKCPAWDKSIRKCNGRNHFKAKCKKSKVHAVNSSDDNDHWLASINTVGNNNSVTAKLIINDCNVTMQVDSGADVNTLCQRYVKKDQVRETNKTLRMWNKTNVDPLGETELTVKNPCNGDTKSVRFVVVPNSFQSLLGLDTSVEIGLITLNKDCFIATVGSQDTVCNIGTAHLTVDPDVPPKTLPCRKVPLAVQDDVEKEINKLVDRGILIPVTEPTKWVSQMVIVRKSNNSLRVCIDPQPLNCALMREYYKLTTIDDVMPMLSSAKIFSKLDVKEAYWHVKLDEPSSFLTTMITLCGRFRWARLPFGLKVSSELFQRRLNEALCDLSGVFSIADDIIVAGCGQTTEEAVRDHDVKLRALKQRCSEQNIVLNDAKQEIRKSEIRIHGHLFTADGVKVDTTKVDTIHNMSVLTDVPAVKRLCGMVQYVSKFLPDLAVTLEPICGLTRKNVPWEWSEECDNAFETVKQKLSDTPVLAYFDKDKEVAAQVDSSKDGLGAVLLQDGRPVEYASRSLTQAERNWAQIEKETLSIVFGLERFDQYTYGRSVIVQNDHKPLAAILKKPLSQVPKRLQALMMRLYRYDIKFQFVEGTQLYIADTLSRANIDIPDLRPRIMNVDCFSSIPDARINEVRNATKNDKSLQSVLSFILNGWPDSKDGVSPEAKPFYDMRDTLSHSEGIILKGEAIVIPCSLRGYMKKRLHSAHLGYDSMMRRARGVIFWPGMAQEIKQLVDCCQPCQELRPRNQRETLKQHYVGEQPWEKIATDLFEIKGHSYLVTIIIQTSWKLIM